MDSPIDEAVTVAAVFSRGTLRPVWFARQGRQVKVREVALTWSTREGRTGILHFSVTDGQGVYELLYNKETLGWTLGRAEEVLS